MKYLLLICAFTLNSAANILLKHGSTEGLLSWKSFIGLALFACNVLFYFLALKQFPLSVAYPVMVASSFFLVNTYAHLVMKESISPAQYVGYAMILLGTFLVLTFSKSTSV